MRAFNFSSGPATLPEPVIRQAQAALWDLDGTGIGILEHSHRGPAFAAVLARAEANVRAVLAVPDSHTVLFISGSASLQFHMVARNFLPTDQVADYCDTGVWSQKAIDEARRIGQVHVACSGQATGYAAIPSTVTWSAAPAYAHFTSNNTIYGTQWAQPPTPPSGVPLVCDASSDLASRPIDVARYAMIYAGAQKNLGPSGLVLVIARRDFIAQAPAELTPLLSYATYARERNLYNTPNTFGIYVLAEVMGWILDQGGLGAMAARNHAKAAALYDAIEASRGFVGHAEPASRSQMNVTFRGRTPAHEAALLAACDAHGLSGLAGHRSLGGLRASLYNAFPEAGVARLIDLLQQVDRTTAA